MAKKSLGPMPFWGPYSKKYMGLSRVMGTINNKNAKSTADAVRFDFASPETAAPFPF